jgi:selenocysteine lyase/cysteine desulfurase
MTKAAGPRARDTERFGRVRAREFPWMSETIYLNNAGIGPLPARTIRALEEFQELRRAPHRLADGHRQREILTEARAAAARLIGADPTEIALCPNTTVGVNLAAQALSLSPGDIVLVSDKEFPANVYPWRHLERQGAVVEMVPVSPEGWPDEARLLERLRDSRVRALAVSMVQFASGYRADLDALGRACRERGVWFVVDAIQGLGQLPLDVRRTPVDLLASGAQKWLLSPWGSGFLYVRRELIERFVPAMAGWLAFEGTDDFSRLTEYSTRFHADARRFEVGTIPYQDIVGMTASLGLLHELGVERIATHLRALRAVVERAAERGAFELASPPAGAHASAIVCVRTPAVAERFRRLGDAGVVASLREGAIRLSPHFYNTIAEMERVLGLLTEG